MSETIPPPIPNPLASEEDAEMCRPWLNIDTSPHATMVRCREALWDFISAMSREGIEVLSVTVDHNAFGASFIEHQRGRLTINPASHYPKATP